MNMPRMNLIAICAVGLLGLSACAPKFNCTKDMKGPGCRSVSQVYDEAHADKASAKASTPSGLPQTIKPGDPLRSTEKVMRFWIAPWEDADGDYHDQSYVYLVLEHGRWFIDEGQENIRKEFAPSVIPPAKSADGAAASAGAGAAK